MNILLTGGLGYIGSHTAVLLLEAGHNVVCYDSLSNSMESVKLSLECITGKQVEFVNGDVRESAKLRKLLEEYKIDSVIHFAGLKAVGESLKMPIDYYLNNVVGTLSLLESMASCNVKNLVFSSSATVYGDPQYLPLDERHPTQAVNPYGRSKLHIEEILSDLALSDPSWRIACMRYFNPVGAHSSGLIGENPTGDPNNLMPYIARVAAGKLNSLSIFGNDYPTRDGTGVRDYIHVMDLAQGHIAAFAFLDDNLGYHIFNLGTGIGRSVLEMIQTFEEVIGESISHRFSSRRPGDVAACYANVSKAEVDLNWKASRTLYDMCASTWNFERQL